MAKYSRIATLKPETLEPATWAGFSDDIARLRGILLKNGIAADDATIVGAWQRHSDGYAAGWIVLYHSDEDNLTALLKQVDLHETLQEGEGGRS